MATYPGALPNLTESIPGTPSSTTLGTSTAGRTHTGHHTQVAEELGAALATLGVDPQGADDTVVERLDRMQGEIDSASSKVIVNDFTTSGVHAWTKPSGAVWLRLRMVGGGAGGNAGSVTFAGLASNGGGAGGSGTIIDVMIPASEVSASGNLTVGAKGAGGAVVTTNDTQGSLGTNGGSSIFDGITALGGLAGAVPSNATTPGAARTGGASLAGDIITTPAGAAGASNTAGDAAAAQSRLIPTSGGGGAGTSGAGATFAGGQGGDYSANNLGWPTAGAAGGTAPGGNGTNGASFRGVGQGGGGGASASGTTNGGAGGNGGYPGGGGGGGGAAVNGAQSGKGGDGGDGRVTLTWYLA